MSSSGWAHLDVLVIARETEKAFQLRLRGGAQRAVWVPKSVVSDAWNYEAGDRDVTVSVQEWFAEKEGLLDE